MRETMSGRVGSVR